MASIAGGSKPVAVGLQGHSSSTQGARDRLAIDGGDSAASSEEESMRITASLVQQVCQQATWEDPGAPSTAVSSNKDAHPDRGGGSANRQRVPVSGEGVHGLRTCLCWPPRGQPGAPGLSCKALIIL